MPTTVANGRKAIVGALAEHEYVERLLAGLTR